MKTAFVTTFDLSRAMQTQKVWANPYLISFFIAQSLMKQSMELNFINTTLNRVYETIFYYKGRLYNSRLVKKRYLMDREPFILHHYARQVAGQLADTNVDLVFSPSTIPIPYLECRQPIVFWTDATFAGMIDFYPGFSNLCRETIKNGNRMEKSALERCKLAIYTSDWAAQTAIKHYGIDPAKVHVVPRGANIEPEVALEDARTMIKARPTGKCKLLFIGNDWLRKGGDIAVAVAAQLNRSGLETELTVVGYRPGVNDSFPPFVRPLGFISKASEQGRDTINQLFAESHFLLLPSRAECSANVFGEASAFGVPGLSTTIGGTPTAIRNNVNGKLFSPQAEIAEYCAYISNLMANYLDYKQLALSSFNEYKSRLNWSVVGQQLRELMIKAV